MATLLLIGVKDGLGVLPQLIHRFGRRCHLPKHVELGVQSPVQIDGGRAGLAQGLSGLLQKAAKVSHCNGF